MLSQFYNRTAENEIKLVLSENELSIARYSNIVRQIFDTQNFDVFKRSKQSCVIVLAPFCMPNPLPSCIMNRVENILVQMPNFDITTVTGPFLPSPWHVTKYNHMYSVS